MSEDRWTHDAQGEDPRGIDRERTDAETVAELQAERQVTHDQEPEREQGTSADAAGVDPSIRQTGAGQHAAEPGG